MPDTRKGISVLVCSFNGAERLAETLACLARQLMSAKISWEVIFVDNASTDGTGELAQRTWEQLGSAVPLHLLQESRPGKQYALEVAVRKAVYEYACIVDDDNHLAVDYLETGYHILTSNHEIGILGGPSTALFEIEEPDWFSTFQQCYAVGPQLDHANGGSKVLDDGDVGRNVLWGAGMFVRSEIWRILASVGFKSLMSGRQGEANLTAGEDDELCYIARLLGYKVWYSSRLHLYHFMTANRLTTEYRDRLVYSSAYSATRLNAYRNALWGARDNKVVIKLFKDIAYSLLNLYRQSPRATLSNTPEQDQLLDSMGKHSNWIRTRELIFHFWRVKGYYEQVNLLKKRLHTN